MIIGLGNNFFNQHKSFKKVHLLLIVFLVIFSLGFLHSATKIKAQSTAKWEAVGWGGGGNATVIEVDPNNSSILWSGADVGGPFKSTDYGKTWKMMNNGYTCSRVISIAVLPGNSNEVYSLCPKGLYQTLNGGASWKMISDSRMTFGWNTETGPGWGWNRVIIFNPQNSNEIFIGSAKSIYPPWEGGAYRNGGGLWKGIKNNAGNFIWQHIDSLSTYGANDIDVMSVVINPTDPQTIYVGALGWNAEMKVSRNGGTSWEETGITNITSIVVSKSNPNIVYAAKQNGHIYRSDNKGRKGSWSDKPISNSGYKLGNYKYSVLTIDQKNSNNLYLGMHNGDINGWTDRHAIYKTENGGNSWKSINKKPSRGNPPNPYIHGADNIQAVEMIAVDPNDFNKVYLASFFAIYKSNDGGNSWIFSSDGFQISAVNRIVFDPNDPNKVYIAGGDSVMMYSPDYGKSWRHVWNHWGQSLGIASANTPSGTMIFFNNGDDNIESKNNGLHQGRIRRASASSIANSNDSTNFYNDPNVWQITSNGLPLANSNQDGFPREGGAVGIEVNPQNPNIAYAAIKSRGIYRTTNALAPADQVRWNLVRSGDPNAFAMSSSNPNYLYATGRNWAWKSTDGGNNWSEISRDSNNGLNELTFDIDIDPVDPNIVYVASQRVVAKSNDGGKSWSRIYEAKDEQGQFYTYFMESVAVDSKNRNRIFVAVSGFPPINGPGVYISKDGGKTFRSMNNGLGRITNAHLFYDSRRDTLWLGTQQGAYKIELSGNYNPPPSTSPQLNADINNDGYVNNDDALMIFSKWGTTMFDLNNDQELNSLDYALLIKNWKDK